MAKKPTKKPNHTTHFREQGLAKLHESPACKGCGERHGTVYDQTCRRDVCKACGWPRPVKRTEPFDPKGAKKWNEAVKASQAKADPIVALTERLAKLEAAVGALAGAVDHNGQAMDKNFDATRNWALAASDDIKRLFEGCKSLDRHLVSHTHNLVVR